MMNYTVSFELATLFMTAVLLVLYLEQYVL
jgi:hypothetical protein